MRHVDPNDHEHVPRPVVAIGNDYPAAFELAPHRHRRAQLLYASEGLVSVSTAGVPPKPAMPCRRSIQHTL